jgi:hypothetical protein
MQRRNNNVSSTLRESSRRYMKRRPPTRRGSRTSLLRKGVRPWRPLRSSTQRLLVSFLVFVLFEREIISHELTVVCANFRNREEELKNALATSRSKIHGLEGKVWEIEAGGLELKRVMKEATRVSTP